MTHLDSCPLTPTLVSVLLPSSPSSSSPPRLISSPSSSLSSSLFSSTLSLSRLCLSFCSSPPAVRGRPPGASRGPRGVGAQSHPSSTRPSSPTAAPPLPPPPPPPLSRPPGGCLKHQRLDAPEPLQPPSPAPSALAPPPSSQTQLPSPGSPSALASPPVFGACAGGPATPVSSSSSSPSSSGEAPGPAAQQEGGTSQGSEPSDFHALSQLHSSGPAGTTGLGSPPCSSCSQGEAPEGGGRRGAAARGRWVRVSVRVGQRQHLRPAPAPRGVAGCGGVLLHGAPRCHLRV